MFKKLIFTFIFSFLTIGFFTSETMADKASTGYSLSDALKISQNIEENKTDLILPKYMPGVHEGTETNPYDFTNLIQNIINGLTGIAGGVAILFIVINAAGLVFSVGNTDAISNAKKGLTWACIGLVLIIFSYIIAKTIINLTYSGENFDTASTVTKKTIVEEEKNPICETNINETESSCYELKEGSTKQTKKTGTCSMESSSIQSAICESMILSEHMEEETSCSLENIQIALKKGDFYTQKDIDDGFAIPDGAYGLATEQAMVKYYESCECEK